MEAWLTSATRLTRASAALSRAPARHMASGKSRARGMRLRYGGAIPGVKYGGKASTEMAHRGESLLEAIRSPTPVVDPVRKWRVLRGDMVAVTSGPLSGRRGRVVEVVRASNRVVVEGVGFVRKYVPQPDGGRKKPVWTEGPIRMSRVQVVCPETGRPTRVGKAFLEDGTKVRVAKVSGAVIPRPKVLAERRVPRGGDGVKDTKPEVALLRTFVDEERLYDGDRYGSFLKAIEGQAAVREER